MSVKLIIDGREIFAEQGENLLEVCKKNGFDVPHLCYHNRIKPQGKCRLCVVEVEGARNLVASCSAIVQDGMIVKTNTERVKNSRNISLQLILSNHNLKCMTCVSNLNCRLQYYAEKFSLQELDFSQIYPNKIYDDSDISIVRDNSKCILCGRCYTICSEEQTVNAISLQNRGQKSEVLSPFNLKTSESNCIHCGQCVALCPTGALSEKSNIKDVENALSSEKMVIVQTAPSVRVALAEMFNEKAGEISTGKMVSALRRLGFDKVFDTNFAADMTIVEEALEFKQRFIENKNLPMITSCCPGWVNFAEKFYPDQLKHLSSCKSPQAMLSSVIKNIYSEKIKKNKEDIVVVDIMPCTAKKYEIARQELNNDADFVLTTVELGKLIKKNNIDFSKLNDEEFDHPMGESTGAGAIFGRSGGVMEAALRTAADWISGQELNEIDYEQVRGMKTQKSAEVKIGEHTIKVCAVHTLSEARKVMEEIKKGISQYHFIEVMACYGGCIGGGGQPRYYDMSVLNKRFDAIKKSDENKPFRKSHHNPSLWKLYEENLDHFGSEKAHKYLHTNYSERNNL